MFRQLSTARSLGQRLLARRPVQASAARTFTSYDDFDMGPFFRHSADTGFVRHSAYGTIDPPNVPIDQFVWRHIGQWPDKVALQCGESDRTLTYAQLRDRCAALAVRLQRPEFGLQHSDVVALCLPNCLEFPVASLGAIEAGLTITTVNPIYTADEIAKQLNISKAKLLIGTVDGHAVLLEAIRKADHPVRLVLVRSQPEQTIPAGSVDFAQLSDPQGVDYSALRPLPDHFDPNSLAFLPFSSGTTGLPKGVMLSHRNIVSNCLQIDAPLPVVPLILNTTADVQDVIPAVLPFFHIYGFTVLLASKIARGCKVITLRQFVPDTFLKALVVGRSTAVHVVPPIVNFMSGHPAVKKEHLVHIRHLMSGAAPISDSDAKRLMDKLDRSDVDFRQGYGMTETSPVCLMNVTGSTRYGSSGGPSPNTEAKIVDVNDPLMRGLPANESGELLVRGPQVMLGYYNNQMATDEILLPDGWLRTGDIGHYDERGYFYVTDRLKELIKVKGFQVAPAELEALLRSHPQVADAAIMGVQDAKSGEVPRAFVVRKANTTPVEEAELKQFVAERVAEFKRIAGGVRFVEAIPKNATGKILRRQLKDL